MRNLIFFIMFLSFFLVVGCIGTESKSTSAVEMDELPSGQNTALNAKPYPRGNLKFFRLDLTPITNITQENEIMVCLPHMEACKSECSAMYYNVERYSYFASAWLTSNQCVAWAIQWPNGTEIPKTFYWIGNYDSSRPASSRCQINQASPDFSGRGAFLENRVPSGAVFPAPDGTRLYYTHSLFDTSENFVTSTILSTYLPPVMWGYRDSSVSATEIVPQLISACVRRDQIQ